MDKTQILEPFPMESITPSKRVHLGEINKKHFKALNQMDLQTTSMSFSALLKMVSID
jgi:cytochrome c oxidase assembly protein Cox11